MSAGNEYVQLHLQVSPPLPPAPAMAATTPSDIDSASEMEHPRLPNSPSTLGATYQGSYNDEETASPAQMPAPSPAPPAQPAPPAPPEPPTPSAPAPPLLLPHQPNIAPAMARRALKRLRAPTIPSPRKYALLAPAPRIHPLTPSPPPPPSRTFFDLPAEIRIEIYRLALHRVTIQIVPPESTRRCPHALIRTSRQTRHEVLPLIHSGCPIRANVTDFNFAGLLTWLRRIPATEQHHLAKNPDLLIFVTTTEKGTREGGTLRQWLHLRADKCRAQPAWRYSGPPPQKSVASDMRRRVKRMSEEGKRAELVRMLGAIGVMT
ncbi:MAG: hypothetical protein FE78DRAFT_237202 [Acidomyces sp. 'richmondensis']|nr:MAG: hypothetical protein FE78DRAFT_237202 [Acidomyces sp. 'richmondensis']